MNICLLLPRNKLVLCNGLVFLAIEEAPPQPFPEMYSIGLPSASSLKGIV